MHYIYVHPEADSRLDLPHGTKQKKTTKKQKKQKTLMVDSSSLAFN